MNKEEVLLAREHWSLRTAIYENNLLLVEELLEQDHIDPNWVYEGSSLISLALYRLWKFQKSGHAGPIRNQSEIVSCLLKHGANANGWTSEKKEEGRQASVSLKERRTLLQDGVSHGDEDMVLQLLHHGANIQQLDEHGNSILHYLWMDHCHNGSFSHSIKSSWVTSLVHQGANPILQNDDGFFADVMLEQRAQRKNGDPQENKVLLEASRLLKALREQRQLEEALESPSLSKGITYDKQKEIKRL